MEKLAAKQGVVLQTVKDVVESLVNDDLIHEDRIGISKYYWCAGTSQTLEPANPATVQPGTESARKGFTATAPRCVDASQGVACEDLYPRLASGYDLSHMDRLSRYPPCLRGSGACQNSLTDISP